MKNRFAFLFLLIVLCARDSWAQPNEDYLLVWQDEFDRDGRPDNTHWVYEKGFVRNKEAQWYQEENAFCRDGFLIIEARREARQNPNQHYLLVNIDYGKTSFPQKFVVDHVHVYQLSH